MSSMASSTTKRLESLSANRTELLKALLAETRRSSRRIRRHPRVEEGGSARVPASASQQRLWFVEQLATGRSAYYVPMTFRIKGKLRQPELQSALNLLAQRHETMRTVFVEMDGDVFQNISATGELALEFVNLEMLDGSERDEQVHAHAARA